MTSPPQPQQNAEPGRNLPTQNGVAAPTRRSLMREAAEVCESYNLRLSPARLRVIVKNYEIAAPENSIGQWLLSYADPTADEARRLTDKIKVGVEGVWHLIEEAYTSRAWAALGYKSWDDYCTREFGTSRLRLPRENRPEVVASLRESGLSVRAIVAATGAGVGTVHRALTGVPNGTPAPQASAEPAAGFADPADAETEVAASGVTESSAESLAGPFTPRSSVTGTDGKTYPVARRQPARPRPAAEVSLNTISSLADRAARESQKLTTDQIRRVKPNAAEWLDGIRNSIEVLSDLVRSLEEN